MGFFVANSNIEGFCIFKRESLGNFTSEYTREMTGVRLSNLNARYNYWLCNSEKYRVSQEECEILRESVPYVRLYRYNPEHLYPKLNGYGDNGKRSLKL